MCDLAERSDPVEVLRKQTRHGGEGDPQKASSRGCIVVVVRFVGGAVGQASTPRLYYFVSSTLGDNPLQIILVYPLLYRNHNRR
mmetsp:Transcript_6659/g.15181  ORF Transcript_6659/g.15181 Transcript_6659/m.15181 type:complete len:84 (+) Transcript_6659:1837-2088(+)